MILSALLTSVGINLALCFLFFTLYSVLRKQPWNSVVYAPRLVDKQRRKESENAASGEEDDELFNLDMLLPSAGWVRCAWQISEDELLKRSGLDAVVFMRIFIFRFPYSFCLCFLAFPFFRALHSLSDLAIQLQSFRDWRSYWDFHTPSN